MRRQPIGDRHVWPDDRLLGQHTSVIAMHDVDIDVRQGLAAADDNKTGVAALCSRKRSLAAVAACGEREACPTVDRIVMRSCAKLVVADRHRTA